MQAGATTDTNGAYSITNVSGQYYLKITPPKSTTGNIYSPYYYNDQYEQCGASQQITITAGETTTLNIDLTQPGGVITGSVVSYDGKPMSGAYVYCSRDTDYMSYGTTTDTDGNFVSGPFYPAINYKCFIYDNGKSVYYNNTTFYSNRTPITVQANTATPNINFQLSKPASTKAIIIPLSVNP
jgi:hypothetical protein